jgi:CubicO group peptidase (beta-lactamase class C family)
MSTGRKIEAEFVSADGEAATISMAGGKKFTVALSRLSAEDQAFVREQLKPAPQPPPSTVEQPSASAADLFEDVGNLSMDKIPVAGESHAALAGVDEAIRRYMADKRIPALTFAVSKDGKLLHHRAFGWADPSLRTPLAPGVRMRLASLTKPVVKAAIQTLIADQKLKADDRVFELLELGRYEEAKGCDRNWSDVTIQHLLDHRGGWDRDKSGDFTFSCTAMARTFHVKLSELEPQHVVRYGLTQKMDFPPGKQYAYCNYGYILLVRVIEKLSGRKFIDYLQATVCKTADAPTFSLSASDARDRQPGEVWYCYHPEYKEPQIPIPFRVEARDGAGVLACSAADYCRFLDSYSISGTRRKSGDKIDATFSGSHPGVTAICAQRPDGINYTAIANRRESGKSDWGEDLRKVVDAQLDDAARKLR